MHQGPWRRRSDWLVLPFDDVRVKHLHMKDTLRLPTAEPLSQLHFPSSFGKKMSFPVPTFIIHNFKDQMGIFFSPFHAL